MKLAFKKYDKVIIKKTAEPAHSGEYFKRAKLDAGLSGRIEECYLNTCTIRTERQDSGFFWKYEDIELCDLEREQMLEIENEL